MAVVEYEGARDPVTSASLTWQERSVRRTGTTTTEKPTHEVSFSMGVRRPRDDRPGTVRVRIRLERHGGGFDAAYEATVTFTMGAEFQPDDRKAVRQFVESVGFSYVFGYICGAYADGTRAMGLRGGLLPALDPEPFTVGIEDEDNDIFEAGVESARDSVPETNEVPPTKT